MTTTMRYTASLLGPLLLELALLLGVASFAHALPFRPSGLGGGASNVLGSNFGGHADGAQDTLPPPPSDMLIGEMNRHNAAFNYDYSLWNRTDLDAASCRQVAERLNGDTAHAHEPCVPAYGCDFDRLRYPHWLVFTSCSVGTGHCEHVPSGLDHRCFPHEEDILMLRYVKLSRSTRNTETADSVDDSAAAGDGGNADSRAPREKPVTREKGEWQLWFVQVPSQCDCIL